MAEKQKMKVYDVEIRLGGDMMTSIPRSGCTDQEIRVLRAIHGEDGVVNVREAGVIEADPQVHLCELAVRYSKSLNPAYGKKLVEDVFRTTLDGFDRWFAEQKELAEMERMEAHDQRQREIAEVNRIREAAEAQAIAEMARRRAMGEATTA